MMYFNMIFIKEIKRTAEEGCLLCKAVSFSGLTKRTDSYIFTSILIISIYNYIESCS